MSPPTFVCELKRLKARIAELEATLAALSRENWRLVQEKVQLERELDALRERANPYEGERPSPEPWVADGPAREERPWKRRRADELYRERPRPKAWVK